MGSDQGAGPGQKRRPGCPAFTPAAVQQNQTHRAGPHGGLGASNSSHEPPFLCGKKIRDLISSLIERLWEGDLAAPPPAINFHFSPPRC